jgi:hypothetical protein
VAATFIPPLERAWERTRLLLLQPFNPEVWLVVGFAAFLAGIGGGGRTGMNWRGGFTPQFQHYSDRPLRAFTDLVAGPVWLLFGSGLVILSLAIGIALLWVSSRAKFVFLDNVLHGRGAIVEPWKRFGELGNSLFIWRLGFLLAMLVLFGALITPMIWIGREMSGSDWMGPAGAATVATGVLLSLVSGVIVLVVVLLAESFVVPLMYHGNLTALRAWGALLGLLRRNPADFLIYGLLVLFAFVALALTWAVSWIVTCCIAPLLLSVPYVATVLVLPLHVVFRLYSVEFLSQFGPEWTISPSPLTSAANPPPKSPAPTALAPPAPPPAAPDSDA